MKYVRFQMAGLFGFILAFLGAAATGVTLVLFTPLQILFVNFIIQAPIGGALGLDSPTPGLMKRKPRPANERIIDRRLGIRLVVAGLIMALFSIGVYQWAKINTSSIVIAQTMAMVMFSIINVPLALNLWHPEDTIFRMETLSNRHLLLTYGWLILALVLVTEIGLFQRLFDTSSLTLHQWSICIIAALLFLIVGETLKFIIRLIAKRSSSSKKS